MSSVGRTHVKCSYHTHMKRIQGALEGVGYVYYIDCGDGIMGVCLCPNSSNSTH